MTTAPDNAPAPAPAAAAAPPPPHPSLLPGLILFCLLSPIAVVNLEWHAYYTQLHLPDGIDRSTLPLLWVLYVKDLLLLLPALLPPLLLPRRRKTALALTSLYVLLLYFWLILDQQTYALTGTHLTHFLRFALGPNAGDWVGSTREVLAQIFRYFLSLTQGALVLIATCAVAAAFLNRLVPRTSRCPAALTLGAVYFLFVALALPAQLTYPNVTNLRRLNDAMPVSLAFLAPGISFPDTHAFIDPFKQQTRAAATLAHDKIFPGLPIDPDARLAPAPPQHRPPNVIVLAVESFRAASLTPDVTPNLCSFARQGLRLDRHYAATNFTHLGLFSLLYARSPALYYQTLTFHVPPQATTTFRNSGYRSSYVCGVEHRGWCWMERYINTDAAFDQLLIGAATPDWPTLDRQTLSQVHDLVAQPRQPKDQPQFVFAFLTSTHYPYKYPPEFLTRKPVWNRFDIDVLKMDPVKDRPPFLNHYNNAVSFLDHEIGQFLRSIDLTQNVVVITGDHGESFWEDGAIGHATRLSDAQTRVPCLILGPNVPPGTTISEPTTHADILPTLLHAAAGHPVPLKHSLGVDLLDPHHPAPPAILGTEGRLGEISMLLIGPHDRRLSVEFGKSRPTPDVLGSVDPSGRLNPFDLPPPSEAPLWADLVTQTITRLTADH